MTFAEQILEWLDAEDARLSKPMPPEKKEAMSENMANNQAVVERIAAKAGCDALLRAHLRTRMHWITDRSVFDATCERLRSGQ